MVVLEAVGAVVGACVLMMVVGWLLPRHHVTTTAAVYAATPKELWSHLTDVRSYNRWRTGTKVRADARVGILWCDGRVLVRTAMARLTSHPLSNASGRPAAI